MYLPACMLPANCEALKILQLRFRSYIFFYSVTDVLQFSSINFERKCYQSLNVIVENFRSVKFEITLCHHLSPKESSVCLSSPLNLFTSDVHRKSSYEQISTNEELNSNKFWEIFENSNKLSFV